MSESASKAFDCVRSMRQVRDEISAEIEDLSYEQLVEWLRGHRYADPDLQRLADAAKRRLEAGDGRRDDG